MPRTNGLKAPGVEPGAALSQLSYTSCEVCAVFARHTPGWIRAGLPGMGGSAFQSGTLGGIPSLPSVLDFLAANWLQEADLNRRYTAYEAAVLPLHHPAMCRGLTAPRRYKIGDMPPSGVGADSGNRTRVPRVEIWYSTIELHPQACVFVFEEPYPNQAQRTNLTEPKRILFG